jgi:hypothetical protein
MVFVVERLDALNLELFVVVGERWGVEGILLLGVRWAVKLSVHGSCVLFTLGEWSRLTARLSMWGRLTL